MVHIAYQMIGHADLDLVLSPGYPWAPVPDDRAWLDNLERNWGRGRLFREGPAGSRVGDGHDEEWFAKLERLAASR